MAVTAVRRMATLRALWGAVRGARRPGAPTTGERLRALPRLVARTTTGSYPLLTRGRLALMAVAVMYLVSPVDLVPEAFLLVLGLADDLLVAGWLAGTVIAETDAFLDWEARERRIVPGEVVRG